jgi:hypothetical protein
MCGHPAFDALVQLPSGGSDHMWIGELGCARHEITGARIEQHHGDTIDPKDHSDSLQETVEDGPLQWVVNM